MKLTIKKEGLILFILAYSSMAFMHDLQLGVFDFYKDDNTLRLDMRLDKEDLVRAVQIRYPYLDLATDSSAFKSCIEEYILENLSIKVNEQQTQIAFYSQQYKKDVISIFANISPSVSSVDNIYIKNTILLDLVEDQANIVTARLYDKERSFRLHKDRISTTIAY